MKKINKTSLNGFINYGIVIAAFALIQILLLIQKKLDVTILSNSLQSLLVPACCYIVMAVSLNLTVGILGELSLGHAGFMSLGAFSGITASILLQNAIPMAPARLAVSMAAGAVAGALGGVIVGVPVLRLQGDYLAIVTLAFGQIIKNIIMVLYVGVDETGFHIAASSDRFNLAEGGVAIIKVGAATETEMKEKKLRIEDALNATRAAVEEGIVAGGGTAYVNAVPAVAKLMTKVEGDEKTGVRIVMKALEEPMKQIATNAGLDGSVVIEKVKNAKRVGYGFDAYGEVYCDMIKAGIVDPTKVNRSALQNAASVAALVLTTEAIVAEKKEPVPPAPAGGGMDMY